MKNSFLALSLILISLSVEAQSLLTSIDLAIPPKGLHEIIREIKLHAHNDESFLSLGESHLQAITSRPLNTMLANQYLDSLDDEAVLCSENIQSFLTSKDGQELQTRVVKTKIMKANSPSQTDFKNCIDNAKYYLTYSGFFHQFPFARSFPLEFVQTPVITQDNNTIMEQMSKNTGMFISQIELDFLQMTASTAFLRRNDLNHFNFNNYLRNLNHKIELLKKSMKKLLDQGVPSKNKFGIFLSQDQIQTPGLKMPKNSYLLLTELESRLNSNHYFSLLSKLSLLKPSLLKRFLHQIQNGKFYFTKDLSEPIEDGSYASTGYGTLPRTFKGKSEFLEIKTSDKHYVIIAEPGQENLSCYLQQADHYEEADCENLIGSATH
jgi:hypothetical protein